MLSASVPDSLPPPKDFTSYFCAHYDVDDQAGKLLAYVSIIPALLIVHTASRAYSRREFSDLFILLGLVVNEALARAIKHAIQEPRPSTCQHLGVGMCDSFGMPSSHTQQMFFILALYGLLLQSRLARAPPLPAFDVVWGLMEVLVCGLSAVAVGLSRLYLGYHTSWQVACGAVLGWLAGVAWYWLLLLAQPHFQRLCRWYPAALLHAKDTLHVSNPLQLERRLFTPAGGKAD